MPRPKKGDGSVSANGLFAGDSEEEDDEEEDGKDEDEDDDDEEGYSE